MKSTTIWFALLSWNVNVLFHARISSNTNGGSSIVEATTVPDGRNNKDNPNDSSSTTNNLRRKRGGGGGGKRTTASGGIRQRSNCNEYQRKNQCQRHSKICQWDSTISTCVMKLKTIRTTTVTEKGDKATDKTTTDQTTSTKTETPPSLSLGVAAPTLPSTSTSSCRTPNAKMACPALFEPVVCGGQDACPYTSPCVAALAGYQATDCIFVPLPPSPSTTTDTTTTTDTANAPCPEVDSQYACTMEMMPVECEGGCTYDNRCKAGAAGFIFPQCFETKSSIPKASVCPLIDPQNICSMEMMPVECNGGCIYDNRCKAGAAGFIFTECVDATSTILPPISGNVGGTMDMPVIGGAMEAPLSEYNPNDMMDNSGSGGSSNKPDEERLPISSYRTFCYYNSTNGEDLCLSTVDSKTPKNSFDCFHKDTPCPQNGKCVMDFTPQCGPRVCKKLIQDVTNPMDICTSTKCRKSIDCPEGYECVSWANDCGLAV